MRTVALALMITATAFAAEGPAGSWTWSMPGPGGQEVTAELTLHVDGEKLTGEFAFNGGSRKLTVTNGSVKGHDVKFTIQRDRPQGGSVTYGITGKIDGNSMKGSASSDLGNAGWTAKRK
ncbi:MAG: hypothetical protein FJW39_31880 [Acidobacteria bacterium]|nr:hypothetical protein [Acidobacteriota bacterium]